MLTTAENNGFNDKALEEMTKAVKETNGDELFKKLADWKQ